MKLVQESEDGGNDRKILKSRTEKRRRERMNRSLERLRTMLLQEPQQGGTQRRSEKTEILEQSVLFLQSSARAEPRTRAGGGGGGGQKHSFQAGFSSCLQRAAHFLGPDGRRLCLGAALDASRAAAAAAGPTSGSLPHTRALLRLLRQKSSGVNTSPHHHHHHHHHPYPQAVTRGWPTPPPQQPQQSPPELRAEPRRSKQSPSQTLRRPLGQTLWRPWP